MGLFDNLWATSESVRVLDSQRLAFEDLLESQLRTLKLLAVSLRDKGMNKDQATDSINKLASKHGGLIEVLDFYSNTFGIH